MSAINLLNLDEDIISDVLVAQEVSYPDGIHPNLKLLSHSSDVLLHKCPRKYELYKLLGRQDGEDENDEHLNFGSVLGSTVQDYLVHGDLQHAIFSAYMAWPKTIDDEAGERNKKTFWHVLFALDKFVDFRRSVLGGYELASFNGRPAVELGFTIDLGDGFFYRGFLDALLIDVARKKLKVFECKSTKFRNIHPAMFGNSGQGLGYSLVVDAITAATGYTVEAAYDVMYPVYKTTALEWEKFEFRKSHTQRATWLMDLLRDKQHVSEYAQGEYFPMHGENCYDFFRPCSHFGVCEMSNKFLIPAGKVKLNVDKPELYTFHFTLEQLIEAQLGSS